jgi:Protein of unknown function (DUF2608)
MIKALFFRSINKQESVLKYTILLLLVSLSACAYYVSNVQEISSIKQAQKELDKANADTLVVFDVDDTLTYNVNVPFQPWFHQTDVGQKFFAQLKKHSQSKEDPIDYEKLIRGKRMLKFTDQPIEAEIIKVIKQLQDRGVNVIALTHMSTGSLRRTLIPSLPKWRWEKLHEVGIEFHPNFGQEEIWLTNLTSQANRHPLYYKGILMTDLFSKGTVLGDFLDIINLKPKKVIFFDDRADFVKSVQEEMKKRGIDFQGYIYRAIDTLPKVFDQKVLDYQLQYLKDHDEFISDEQAKRAIY